MPDPIILAVVLAVGVVLGVILCAVLAGAFVLRHGAQPAISGRKAAAKHRPSLRRRTIPVPRNAIPREPRHSTEPAGATQAMAPVHPSYLGPDVERAQQLPVVRREPVTTGGAR